MSDPGGGSTASAVKKERSPSFPFIGLSKAIERVRAVHATARRYDIRVGDIAAAWGIGAKSSGTLQTVAALLAYGLLDEVGTGTGEDRKMRVSDLAFRALEDQRPGQREAALSEAATRPKLIAEYAVKWRDGRPADHICESELRIERGFTQEGARQFLRVFDDTIRFVTSSDGDKKSDKKGEETPAQSEKPGAIIHDQQGTVSPKQVSDQAPPADWLAQFAATHLKSVGAGAVREEKFSLSEGSVTITYPDRLSAESVEDLEAYLQIFLKKAKREAKPNVLE